MFNLCVYKCHYVQQNGCLPTAADPAIVDRGDDRGLGSTKRASGAELWWRTRSGGARNFHLGAIVQGFWRRKFPVGSRREAPEENDEIPKQFPDIVYRFWLQKRSKFENFARFTFWFLTSMFYEEGAKRHFGCLAPPQLMPGAGGKTSIHYIYVGNITVLLQ